MVDEDEARRLERCADERAEAGDYAGALALREQAFAAWRARGDTRRAAYLAAYQIAFDHLALFGHQAVAHGWLERGRHLAEETGECAESGWVALARALFADGAAERDRLVAEATRLADRFGDGDLHFDALAYTGLSLVEAGRVTDGMRRLDEAAAAARGGEVSSRVVAGEIYCKMLVACEGTLDVRRAEEWQQVTAPFADQPAVAWVSAICRMHHGGILVAAGRWQEADVELTTAVRLYDESYRALRTAALARLAELRVRQGRLGEARQLLEGEERDGYALRPWARAAWAGAQDSADRASVAARLERRLGEQGSGVFDVPLLALLAEIQVADGAVEAAARTARRMGRLTDGDPVDALVGYARQAEAAVSGASAGHHGAARRAWESAIAAFSTARLPLEEAGARLHLAELVAPEDPALATAEARTAAEAFAWLGAPDGLDRANALLRSLGGPSRSGVRRPQELTDREQEVLSLVAQGLSNPQIAERLFISRKTASHHVSSVLAKLGVRNRAEAAAWASARGRDTAR